MNWTILAHRSLFICDICSSVLVIWDWGSYYRSGNGNSISISSFNGLKSFSLNVISLKEDTLIKHIFNSHISPINTIKILMFMQASSDEKVYIVLRILLDQFPLNISLLIT